MEEKRRGFVSVCSKFKPHMLMILVQLAYSFLNLITEASFNHGLNPFVYVTYRHIVGTLVMFPFAYFLERKTRPKLTLALFLEFFVLSFVGVTLSLNMYFASLRYTNSTFVTSILNTVASITLVIAVALRLEVINIRNPRGIAKLVGTLVSLGGAMMVTLYKGPTIENLRRPLIHIHGNNSGVIHEDWFKGSLLAVASCIGWSIWYIMQAYTLRRYPAQLSLTTWMCFIGAAQSAIFTKIVVHNRSAWIMGFNIDLWNILYSGVVGSGLANFITLWCTEEKGPVFTSMYNPLAAVIVAILSYFVLGDKLYLGCIIGAIIVIIGLYMLLWGKEDDEDVSINTKQQQCTCTSEKSNMEEAEEGRSKVQMGDLIKCQSGK